MRVSESGQRLAGIVDCYRQGNTPLFQNYSQRLAFNELHCHNEVVTGPKRVVHGRDIGMAQAGMNLDLTQETLGFLRAVRRECLDGLNSFRKRMLDLENLAHSPFADQTENFVYTDNLPRPEAHSFTTLRNMAVTGSSLCGFHFYQPLMTDRKISRQRPTPRTAR